jgi:hypothetical protein
VDADRPAEVVDDEAEVVEPEPVDQGVEDAREERERVLTVDRLARRAEAREVGTTTRWSFARTGVMSRYRNEEVGQPWSRRSGGPSPSST